MGRLIEFECEVRPADYPKRQSLSSMVDIGMLTAGFRVHAGTYRVVIEKLDPPKKKRDEHGSK